MDELERIFLRHSKFELCGAEIKEAIEFINKEEEKKHIQRMFIEDIEALKEFGPFFLMMDEWNLPEFTPAQCCFKKWIVLVIAAKTADGNSYKTLHMTVEASDSSTMGSDKIYDSLKQVLDYITNIMPETYTNLLAIISNRNSASSLPLRCAVKKYPCLLDIKRFRKTLASEYGYVDQVLAKVYNQYTHTESTWRCHMDEAAEAVLALKEPELQSSKRISQELEQIRRLMERFFAIYPSGELDLFFCINYDLDIRGSDIKNTMKELVESLVGTNCQQELKNSDQAAICMTKLVGVCVRLLS